MTSLSDAGAPALRARALHDWFVAMLPQLGGGQMATTLEPVSGDASFRRYFRAVTDTGNWILVDAPPPHEDSRPFIAVASRLHAAGVAVPPVLAADVEQGFMCLGDFGDVLLWSKLAAAQTAGNKAEADALYRTAFAELLKIQQCPVPPGSLPLYDETLLLREMRLFSEWFCTGLMGRPLTTAEEAMLEAVFGFLMASALGQTQVFVHRDYHSRNLMFRPGQAPGVIDFQDAVLGPVTYDLVSLLKDCYIAWPRAQINAWALEHARGANAAGIAGVADPRQFLRDFDLMGAQRHIKVLGIFSRLWLRDGKPGYLRDIPRTMDYLVTVAAEHQQLADFSHWLHVNILPALPEALVQATARKDGTRA